MRYALAAVVLALLSASPVAAADLVLYSHTTNVGVDHPLGPEIDRRIVEVSFGARAPATRFSVAAYDYAGAPVWMVACLWKQNACAQETAGRGSFSMESPAGTTWPIGTVIRVWVYTLYASTEGTWGLSTWGGLRAEFGPIPQSERVIPYVAAGYAGGNPWPIDQNLPCGSLTKCSYAPTHANKIEVELRDQVVPAAFFEVCASVGGTLYGCLHKWRFAELRTFGGWPPGTKVDIRPYFALAEEPAGTRGLAIIRYIA